MIVLSTLPAKVFSSMIPDLTVTTDMSRVHFKIYFGSWMIYDENLYPDTNGKINVGGMPELVESYARHHLVANLNVTMEEQQVTTDESGRQTVTFVATETLATKVIYCAAKVSIGAEAFCRLHFLSRLLGTKVTAPGRMEVLHYDSAEDAVVKAFYDDGTTTVFNASKIGGNENYSTVDVSPSLFTNGKNLYKYEVTAGERYQRYDIDMSGAKAQPSLLFTNSFGCQDTFYCTGLMKTAPELKYSSILIDSHFENYDIDEIRNFSADTGPLSEPMADWASDLFRSYEIYLLNTKGGSIAVGARINLSDVKGDYDNADDTIIRFSFSYKYAAKNQDIIDTGAAGRIFDMTFDNTFN